MSVKRPVSVGKIQVGGGDPVIIAGPCAVESREQILKTADFVKAKGATMLRGGAYKPRTNPRSFRGLGEEGVNLLVEAKERTGLPIVTELMDVHDLEVFIDRVDVIQIGSRNMYNYALLTEVGKLRQPILLKRGMSATIEEWIMAAEYILKEGNDQVILCERGIRTYDRYTRNTLDLTAIPIMQKETGLPVVVDPSHGIGLVDYIPIMSRAALAAGADGLMVEVHPNPQEAFSDGEQSLSFEGFEAFLKMIKA